MRAALAGLAAAALVACATVPQPVEDRKEIVADHVRSAFAPIIPSVDDRLTDGTAQQILMHNCVGYRLGYWNSPGMAVACDFSQPGDAADLAEKPKK